jgi:ER-bound oxygenase mpaB/B'/Rubber oxygenase, catalytic domain
MDSMRQVMDPPADAAVKEVFERGEVQAVNDLMYELLANDQIIPERLPESVQHYLDQTGRLPDWAKPETIEYAEDFFARNGMLVGISLLFSSLPMCYACAKGVQVLHLTARLQNDPKRRIAETSQMLINVASPGGIAPNGRGIRDAQKVRLMHAALRYLILKSGQWDSTWGQPINQEDLGGTLLSFSYIPIEALDKLGATLQPQEAEAYLHMWNVVGHLMGVRSELLPQDVNEARGLVTVIGRRNFEVSEAGRAMTCALVEMMEDVVPGTIFRGMPDTMIRFLNGDQIADIVGVSNEDWTRKLIAPIREMFAIVEGEEDRSRMLAKVAEHFGHAFMEAFSWIDRGDRAPFQIPDALRQQWNLRAHPGTLKSGLEHLWADVKRLV